MQIHYADNAYTDVIDVTLKNVGQNFQKISPSGAIVPPSGLVVTQINSGGYQMLFGNAITGEAIVQGDIIAIDNNGKLWKADKDTPGRQNFIGVATENAGVGVSLKYQTAGVFSRTSGTFNVLGPIYMGNMGAITTTPPNSGVSLRIGYISNSTDMIIQALSRLEL